MRNEGRKDGSQPLLLKFETGEPPRFLVHADPQACPGLSDTEVAGPVARIWKIPERSQQEQAPLIVSPMPSLNPASRK